jgi:hypothetical protein
MAVRKPRAKSVVKHRGKGAMKAANRANRHAIHNEQIEIAISKARSGETPMSDKAAKFFARQATDRILSEARRAKANPSL